MNTAADTVLSARTSADPAAPLVTHYDVGLRSRIEQSTVSTGNWAAKIAGLLRDEVGLLPGDDVLLDLPAHWLTPGVLLGAWWAGGRVLTPQAPGGEPRVIITVADRLDTYPDADEVLLMSLDPMGRGLVASGVDVPVGVTDLVDACRIHPDAFTPSGGTDPCFADASVAALADEGTAGRVLVNGDDRDDVVRDIAAVLAAGGSLVLVTALADAADGPDATLDSIAGTEKATDRL